MIYSHGIRGQMTTDFNDVTFVAPRSFAQPSCLSKLFSAKRLRGLDDDLWPVTVFTFNHSDLSVVLKVKRKVFIVTI